MRLFCIDRRRADEPKIKGRRWHVCLIIGLLPPSPLPPHFPDIIGVCAPGFTWRWGVLRVGPLCFHPVLLFLATPPLVGKSVPQCQGSFVPLWLAKKDSSRRKYDRDEHVQDRVRGAVQGGKGNIRLAESLQRRVGTEQSKIRALILSERVINCITIIINETNMFHITIINIIFNNSSVLHEKQLSIIPHHAKIIYLHNHKYNQYNYN